MEKKIISLDIDGVLQPPFSQIRFAYDLDELKEELAEKYNDPEYLKMDKYDLGAVYYDWDKDAVYLLRTLCELVPAEIVISSSWKNHRTLDYLKRCFKLHELDRFVVDTCPVIGSKAKEIKAYLDAHPEIKKFIILEDAEIYDLKQIFEEEKIIRCEGKLGGKEFYESIRSFIKQGVKLAPKFL